MSTLGSSAAALLVVVVAALLRSGPLLPRRSGPARTTDERAEPSSRTTARVVGTRRFRPGFVEQRRSTRAIEQAWPDTVELLVHAVEAGLTPRQAMDHLVAHGPDPTRAGFAAVVHRTERGQPFADALRALPDVLGAPANLIADVIGASDRYGLPLAPALDRLAGEARDSRRRLEQAAARKLPVRLSFPLVTCTLPSFVLLAIAPAVIAALSSLGGTAW